MNGIKDTATVTLNVNGAQAKQMMSDIEAKIKQTEARITSLKANMADPKDVEKARKQLKTYQKQLEEMKSATEGVNKALGNLDTATPRELEKALRTLNKQLKDMTPGSEVWQSHVEQIKELKERLADIRDELKVQESWWDKLKNWVNDSGATILALGLGFDEVVGTLRDYVDAYADMEQEMANVRKFTGMTEEQVASLNEQFKTIDTRSSREQLNMLAQEAGRLGKTSEEDVLGFVRAADKINVALDDLGSGATLTLSKLTGIFGDEERYGTEQALLKVGSVINDLSQNCSASAPYLSNFAERMGGVGAQAGMTIQQIMGFGAVLDSNALKVEASATALSQIIVRLYQDPAKYAKVAGLEVESFSRLMREDANSAILLFLETLQKAGGMDVLSPMFKDMGENGSRAIAALSTLATHIDQVKAQQKAANVAFAEGTSIDKEFAVQNETVQAALDKCKNRANELRVELGERLYPLMKHLLTSGSAMMRVLLELIKFFDEHKAEIAMLTASITAYNIAINLAAIKTAAFTAASKLMNAALVSQRLAVIAVSGVMALLSGNITRATAAFKLFSLAIKANPIGLAVSLITTAVVAIGSWINKVNEARKAEQLLARQRQQQAREFRQQISDISITAGDYAKKEQDRLKKLYDATQDATKSQKERIAAVMELQTTYPTAFGNLSQEKILAGQAAAAYETLSKNIIKAARAKAAAEKIKDNEKLLLDLEIEREELEQTISDNSEALEKAIGKRKAIIRKISAKDKLSLSGPSAKEHRLLAETGAAVQNLNDNLDASAERLETIIMQTGELTKANEKLAKKAEDASKITPDIDFSTPTVTTHDGPGYVSQEETKKAERERKKKEAEERRAAAKAKRDFKAQLDAYKAQRSSADREVLELYKTGSIDYEELLRRRHENELKYYDSSLDHFEKVFADQKDTYLQDDKDYQKLLLDREKSDEKYEQNRIALALASINRRKVAEEQNAQHIFDMKSDPTIRDEIALQSELYRIRMDALVDTRALYNVGSKEYADVQYQIEALELEKEMTLKKTYFKAVSTLRKEYDKKSAAEKFELEKATLDALLKANILTAEQYARYLKGLAEKYKQELPGQAEKSWSLANQNKYDDDTKALEAALNSQLITQAEFNERMANLDQARREKMLAGLKETGGEWNAMLVDVYTSFANLLDGFDGSLEGTLENIGDCVSAVSAVVGAGMQIATEFARAEAEIQIKAIEKRYDREISLAQGNSYKVKKLEEKKEKETAKVKNEASKKQYAMQIVQAIAQSLVAGLNAYSSTMAIPIVGPALAPAAMAVALAMGATQVALLKKQQKAAEAQGYSKGGFTKPGPVYEPAGVVHAGEWVASQKLLANPVARPMIDALDHAQRTNTIGSLRPDDVSRSITANNSLARIAEGDGSSALMVAAAVRMSQTVDNLTDRLNEPFVTINTVTGDLGIKQAEDEYKRLVNNITPKKYQK